MITIGYCTKEHSESHIEHLIKTCGLDRKKIEVIEIINSGDRSLTECYNEILTNAKYDIVVYTHNDATIETNGWGRKVLKHFEKNPEYGILGVAGTKSLPSSGKWWESFKKLRGRVKHTHEGKTWLSAYSSDIGNNIEEVVIVDGVFFSIHKNRIKKGFDETVEGFHFYDVTFGFDNYLAGVKVGVHTNIRVNHKSIGITNDQWEVNRALFADKYKDKLPVNIKRIIRPHEKIKVLIGCLNFNGYTGSELYVYELAKELINQGCDVSICSQIGNPLARQAKSYGIKLYSITEPPGYKLGDGEFILKTNNGEIKSEKGKLYKVSDIQFDILHLNHKPITEHLLRLYPDTPAIASIHSEVIALEYPVIHPNIKKYIAIRPEIKEFLIHNFSINENMVDIVYNPIDYNRFKIKPEIKNTNRTNKRILSVSTIDYLRKNMLIDLIETTRTEGDELWIVGKKNQDDYLTNMIVNQPHVKYFEPTFKVEDLIHQVDITSGVLLGRVTIESWLCGKPAWVYKIDDSGNIKSKTLTYPPEDINKFKSDVVAKIIIEKYKEIIE